MAGQGTCFEGANPEAKKDSVYHQVREFLDKGETMAVATRSEERRVGKV